MSKNSARAEARQRTSGRLRSTLVGRAAGGADSTPWVTLAGGVRWDPATFAVGLDAGRQAGCGSHR